jgi:A/G-specific adenine glycosylase
VTVLVIVDPERRVLLERRAEHGVWGGLYSFPEHDDAEPVEQWCAERLGTRPRTPRRLEPVAHAFTHFDLNLNPVAVELTSAPGAVMDRGDWLWYNPAGDQDVGLAAPIAKLIRELSSEDPSFSQ